MGENPTLMEDPAQTNKDIKKRKTLCKTTDQGNFFDTLIIKIGPKMREEFCLQKSA